MEAPHPKLYGPKQIAIIACSMVAGTALFIFRRLHENGRLTSVDAFAAVMTVIVGTTIAVVIVRKGNKKE